ncbi:MAG: MAPEG family protein [Usitatibacter sp.]
MTFAYWCVLAAAMLPYVTVGFAKKTGERYNNRAPRDWEQKLEGRARRAVFAHQNHFEAFPAFAAAVIIAHLAGAPQLTVDIIAGIFIAARVAYTFAYIADAHLLRSTLWFVGFACIIALFAAGAAAR